jgi:hypothetical protein
MSEISFHLKYGLLYISVALCHNDKELVLDNCIFDTGSGGTVFDIDEVSKIDIQATPESPLKRLKTVGGYQTVFIASLDQLRFGQECLKKVGVEVGNLHSKFGIQGIIGTDLMGHFDWRMRFSDQKLVPQKINFIDRQAF